MPRAVDVVVRALQADLTKPWRLDALATLAGVDPAYLSRICRQHLGTSPTRYLARLRAERAAVLLTRTDLPVSGVGGAVGWPDPNYFARRFRDLVGVSPSTYRLQATTGSGGVAHSSRDDDAYAPHPAGLPPTRPATIFSAYPDRA